MLEIGFLIAAAVAFAATLGVVVGRNPVHSLLNLIVSLLAVAMIFFMLGAPFAAMLELIVYAGAIMVLFVFVVMMLNLGKATEEQERKWLCPRTWVAPGVLVFVLLGQFAYVMSHGYLTPAGHTTVSAKQVGVALFGPWLLAVELASMLLLAALVTAFHLGRQQKERGE
ncbi:MAG TPA: NADH-quinone oxidoreductase subunit J [Moraxellaceae bacterium]|nr:NADH-quinone oxidoreductase subunit J [Moraxellaceae bacterium]